MGTEWRDQAACAGRGEVMHDLTREAEAKAVCAACPVLLPCAAWANTPQGRPVPGVLAGRSERERLAARHAGRCDTCHQVKPADRFVVRIHQAYAGQTAMCRSCRNAASRRRAADQQQLEVS